jgi:2-dehydro-3-deoxyglucarate aldolase/4-hydroxy-2-oxoheptanedioate aldolase
MEAGCSGVMIAQIRTLDQVKQAVQWVKYPPVGERGMFAATFEANYGELDLPTHIANANRDRWLSVQIETVEALNVVEQIASVEGVDWLFVGPVDLSIALGVPGDFLHPRCVDALTRVAAAVKKHDKPWGILCREPTHAKQCQALGAQLFSVAGDIECFRTGLQHIRTRFTEVFAEN